MVKKLTNEEEEYIKNELKKFLKPKTLPDVIRLAVLRNKWRPDAYNILVKNNGEDKLLPLEDVLARYENNNMSELDKIALAQVLNVPKIKHAINREFGGVVTKVLNEQVAQKKEQLNSIGYTLDTEKKRRGKATKVDFAKKKEEGVKNGSKDKVEKEAIGNKENRNSSERKEEQVGITAKPDTARTFDYAEEEDY